MTASLRLYVNVVTRSFLATSNNWVFHPSATNNWAPSFLEIEKHLWMQTEVRTRQEMTWYNALYAQWLPPDPRMCLYDLGCHFTHLVCRKLHLF